ncbi:hypothetical protein IJH01_00115 [Candidatus Saccharibacteria bacterium]|nr:hypothetical protein [Candidatus Saccharibacteria bacterium]
MKKIKYLVVGIAALIGSIVGINNVVVAEGERSSLTVSPPSQEIVLIPGETYEGSIKVSNSNDSPTDLSYSLSIGSFSQKQGNDSKDDYGTVDTETVSSYNQIMEWIELGVENGVVAPNEFDTIPFSITVPENAPAGGQYATIMVQDDTKRGDENGNITIESKTRIAVIIYAEVAGETKQAGSISENDIPSFLLSNKLEATSMVKNEGNVHAKASYVLQVWPLFSDEEVCTNFESPSESLIMPETSRFHVEECNLPSIGIFRAKQTVKIFGEESVVEKIIIFCPIWLLFIIFFVIAAIIIWIVMRIRGKNNSSRQKNAGLSE